MKAREIRERLQGKIEPQVLYVLEALAEQQNVLREQLMTMAMQQDEVINIVGQFSQVAANMKHTVDVMRGKEHETDSHD